MFTKGAITAAILFAMTASASAESQHAADSTEPSAAMTRETELESVTVEARRRQERITKEVSEFVSSVVAKPMHESLPRWAVPVCAFTAGLAPSADEFVRKRVAEIATGSGVPLGRSDCSPNFVIVVTPDPERFLKDWWEADHRLFSRERGVAGVDRFIETDQPVRVWHNACSAPPGVLRNFTLDVTWGCNTGTLGTRLTHESVRALYLAIIMVDLSRIEGLTFGQVADYVSMVGLVQVRSNRETGATPTILHLFAKDAGDKPAGLTDWDKSFLKAIYATTEGSITELSQIKLRMGRELAK